MGGKVETVTGFISLGSKIPADGDYSQEIKSLLLLVRKPMTNQDSILKSRDITLLTNVHIVKAMAFPVVMYRRESWITKKAEWQRIDAFESWCYRRLLRVPWTARRSNQSILKEISPEYTLGGLMLKLKLQYFGQVMKRADSLEKILMLGKAEGKRGRRWDWVRWRLRLRGHESERTPGDGDGREAWRAAAHRVTESRTRLTEEQQVASGVPAGRKPHGSTRFSSCQALSAYTWPTVTTVESYSCIYLSATGEHQGAFSVPFISSGASTRQHQMASVFFLLLTWAPHRGSQQQDK